MAPRKSLLAAADDAAVVQGAAGAPRWPHPTTKDVAGAAAAVRATAPAYARHLATQDAPPPKVAACHVPAKPSAVFRARTGGASAFGRPAPRSLGQPAPLPTAQPAGAVQGEAAAVAPRPPEPLPPLLRGATAIKVGRGRPWPRTRGATAAVRPVAVAELGAVQDVEALLDHAPLSTQRPSGVETPSRPPAL